jgi:hypothetical protein
MAKERFWDHCIWCEYLTGNYNCQKFGRSIFEIMEGVPVYYKDMAYTTVYTDTEGLQCPKYKDTKDKYKIARALKLQKHYNGLPNKEVGLYDDDPDTYIEEIKKENK